MNAARTHDCVEISAAKSPDENNLSHRRQAQVAADFGTLVEIDMKS
jgi:hypothetical protein